MPAVVKLSEGPPMPNRSRVMAESKSDTLVLQAGGWARGLLPLPVKHILVSNPSGKPWKRRMNGQHQLKNKDSESGTWNVPILLKLGASKSLLQQLNDYRVKMAEIQKNQMEREWTNGS
jgi:hypothetical protein